MAESGTIKPSSPSDAITAGSLMAISVEMQGARACLLENVSGRYRLVGWAGVRRTPDAPIHQTVMTLCRRFGSRLGRQLWDDGTDGPLLASEDAVRYPPLTHFVASASPRPRLRVWLAGLSSGVSLAAARQAIASSPVQIVGESALLAGANGAQLAADFADQHPEVVIVTGGYDSQEPAAQKPLLDLLAHVGNAVARLPQAARPTLIFAGNRSAGAQAQAWFSSVAGASTLIVLGNVLPKPGRVYADELAHALRVEYRRACSKLPGFTRLARWSTNANQVDALENGFAQLVHTWMEHQALPELHGLYCTSDWWFHVWARRDEKSLRLFYVEANQRLPDADRWPAVQLVSGNWPQHIWPSPAVAWWDRVGMAPMLAGIGQVEPSAMLQVLGLDILERPPRAEAIR